MRSKNPEMMKKIASFAESYYMANGRSPSTSEIAAETGITRGTVYKYLVAMDKAGMVKYDGCSIVTSITDKYEPSVSCVPVCGSIPCGSPMEEEENIDVIVTLPRTIFGPGELFILAASGDSMVDAGISDGDYVVLARQETAEDGDIVAALVDGTVSTLKTYHVDKKTGEVFLKPENRKYDVIRPKNSLSVQGVVRKIIKDPASAAAGRT